jgi:TonB family protein
MKPTIAAVLLMIGLENPCWAQVAQSKSLPPECTKTTRAHGSFPKGPFSALANESYKRSPTIKYEIQEDGTVSNATIAGSSGVADMDKKVLDAIALWKYKPRPAGCGVIETEMSVTFDPPPVGGSANAVATPTTWHKVDAGPFSILAPPGWEFHQLMGVDSFVGEFVGDGVVLTFDYGRYARGYLKEDKKPAYVIAHKSIGGFPSKIVSPRTPNHGVTGVYFHNVGRSNALCLYGKDLTSAQQELVLNIFETIRFGGPVPRYVSPPPPPAKNVL